MISTTRAAPSSSCTASTRTTATSSPSSKSSARADTRAALALGTLAVLALAAACKKAPEAAGFTPPPTLVEAATVEQGLLREELSSLGTVEASERVQIVSEIDALVEELPFVEGAFVAKGRVLARLRDADIRAGVERARALRDEAKVAYDRLSRLTDELVVSRQEQDTAAAKLAVAEADLRVAEVQLQKTRVLAPFAGLLSRRLISSGAYLRAGDPIVELAAIDEVKVAFTVSERHLAALKLGSGVLLESVSYPGERFAGAIAVVDPLVDPTTRSAQVIARIANPERKLRPGLSAAVSVPLAERSSALTVPEEAVVAEGETNFVFRIGADAIVEKRPVTLGMRQGGKVEVLSGLEGGDRVVRAGHQKLFPGAQVTAADEAEAGGAEAGKAEASDNPAAAPAPE